MAITVSARSPSGTSAGSAATADGPGATGETRFEALVLDFLAYLEFERGLSRNTLEAYRSDLLRFGQFLAQRGREALAAEHGDLAAFLAELATAEQALPASCPPTLQPK